MRVRQGGKCSQQVKHEAEYQYLAKSISALDLTILKTLPCLMSFIMFRGRGLEARLSLRDVCHCIDGYESVRNKNSETISLLTTSS